MGRVVRVTDGGVLVEPAEAHRDRAAEARRRRGVRCGRLAQSARKPEEGGRMFQVQAREGKLELRFGNGAIHADRIRRGDLVWRTHDPDMDKVARPYTEATAPLRKQAVNVRVTRAKASRCAAEWRVGRSERDGALGRLAGHGAESRDRRGVSCAHSWAAWETRRTNWPELNSDIDGSPFAPSSLLNQLRREAVEQLQEAAGIDA